MNPCCKEAIKALLTPRPIETAPTGMWISMFFSSWNVSGWEKGFLGTKAREVRVFNTGSIDLGHRGYPTHWLPLPEDLIKEVDAL